MKNSKSFLKKLGLIVIGLCAACCLLPFTAVIFGFGALAALSTYIEWIGILALIIAGISFGINQFRKRQAPACDTDCSGKEETRVAKR